MYSKIVYFITVSLLFTSQPGLADDLYLIDYPSDTPIPALYGRLLSRLEIYSVEGLVHKVNHFLNPEVRHSMSPSEHNAYRIILNEANQQCMKIHESLKADQKSIKVEPAPLEQGRYAITSAHLVDWLEKKDRYYAIGLPAFHASAGTLVVATVVGGLKLVEERMATGTLSTDWVLLTGLVFAQQIVTARSAWVTYQDLEKSFTLPLLDGEPISIPYQPRNEKYPSLVLNSLRCFGKQSEVPFDVYSLAAEEGRLEERFYQRDVKLTEIMGQKDDHGNVNCPICNEALEVGQEVMHGIYKPGSSCKHAAHETCARGWLQSGGSACPSGCGSVWKTGTFSVGKIIP